MKRGNVLLIMPVRNEARDLADVLASLQAQTFTQDRLYLLVIDGESSDATPTIVADFFARALLRGELISNPRRTIASGLNLGIARAQSDDYIVRLDGHTVYGPGYLKALLEALEAAPPDVGCTGGAQKPSAGNTFSQRVVSTLYSNRLGLGGSEHRVSQTSGFLSQVYLGAWRPGVLQQIGGFDERWLANEDSELCARMQAAGYRILWVPVESAYRINRGIFATIAQWGRYGYWRAQTLRRHPAIARPRHCLAPLALLLGLAFLLTPLREMLAGFVALYAIALWVNRDPSESAFVTIASLVFLPACQVAWTLGMLRGLLFPAPLALGMLGFALLAGLLAPRGTNAMSAALPLQHIRTLAFVESSGKPYRFGTHWANLQPYVDYAVVSPRAANQLAALGIKTGFYVNIHTICVPQNYGECQPDARTLPEAAFVHSCSPPYGRVMWNPEKSSTNPHPLYQYLGNIHAPVLLAQWNAFIDRMRQSPWGPVHFDFAFEDNATVPGDNLQWRHYYVRGSAHEQLPRPYCGYSDQRFISDELHLENQAHLPLLLNALSIADTRPQPSLAVTYLPHSSHALGAMLEYAYGSTINGPEREKEGDDIWRSEENTELAMVRGHKIFFAYPHNGGEDQHALDVRGYQYASLLLSFDQRYVALAQDGPGTRSGIGLNPEIGLVASQPLLALPKNIEGLRQNDGAYVREFARCRIWGKKIGGCVAIVNPSSTRSVAFPVLTRRYRHRIALSGAGVVAGIDDGRLRLAPLKYPVRLRPKSWAFV